MSDPEANKQLIREYFDALNSGNLDRLFALFADDLDYWVPGDWQMGGHRGKQEFRALMDAYSGGPPMDEPLHLTPHAFTAEGNRVAVEATSSAKNNGKVYANTYHMLFVIENGKIKNLHEYLDTKKAIDFFFG